MNATLKVSFDKQIGKKINPLHGVNGGPRTCSFVYDARPLFVEAGLPFVRLHDVEYPFGSGEYVDIPCIFKNFDADENDPASYNFALTDEYIKASLSVGSKVIYRLGVSIEHAPVKRYTYPPKDFAKWARICEHIIRHYNEGWADGHRWNIEYFEIWNEADAESTKCWAGTQEQFIEFYSVAATYLKKCFPSLKIGGCSFTGSHPDNVERFIESVASKGTPLDFFSFHSYSRTPEKPIGLWRRFRDKLEGVGLGEVEMMLTEWNYMENWNKLIQPSRYIDMKGVRGAAYYAAMLCGMQHNTDMTGATYFEADVVKEFCGIFNVKEMRVSITSPATLAPTKGFYAFKSFNSLYRMGNEVEIECDNEAIWCCAASGECGNGLIVSNQNVEHIDLDLSLSGVKEELVVRLTDSMRTYEIIQRISPEASGEIKLVMPPESFIYVGTDLPDPIPTYDPDCYKNISVAAPKENVDSFFN